MKIGDTKRVEEVTILLEESVDFSQENLEPNSACPALQVLNMEWLRKFAMTKGYCDVSFNGHYQVDTKSVVVKFRKNLFI